MINPYTPPNVSVAADEVATLIRRPFHLLWVALFFGGCGSVQTFLQTTVWAVGDACMGEWRDQLLCKSDYTWPVSVLVCLLVPVATHALLLSRFGGRRMGRLGIGALSVVLSVVVSFGCWRLMLDIPLLWNGVEYFLRAFIGVCVIGGALSLSGILLSGMLEFIVVRSQP